MFKRQRVPQTAEELNSLEKPEERSPPFHVAARDPVLKTRVKIESPVLVTINPELSMVSETPQSKRRHSIVFVIDDSNAMSDVWLREGQSSNMQAVNTLMRTVLDNGIPNIAIENIHIGIVVFGTEADLLLPMTALKGINSKTYPTLEGNGGSGNLLLALDLASKLLRENAPVDSIQSVVVITAAQPSSGIVDGRLLRKHLTQDVQLPLTGQIFFHAIGIGENVNAAFFKGFCDEGRGALFAFAEDAKELPVAFNEITSSIAQIEGAIVVEIHDGHKLAPRLVRLGVKFSNQGFCKEIYVTPHEMKVAAAQGPRIKIKLLGFEGEPEGGFSYKYCTKPIAEWQTEEAFALRDEFYNAYLLGRREVEIFRTTVAKAESWIKKAAVAQMCFERSLLIKDIKRSPIFARMLAENRSYQMHKNCISELSARLALLHATRTAAMCSHF